MYAAGCLKLYIVFLFNRLGVQCVASHRQAMRAKEAESPMQYIILYCIVLLMYCIVLYCSPQPGDAGAQGGGVGYALYCIIL